MTCTFFKDRHTDIQYKCEINSTYNLLPTRKRSHNKSVLVFSLSKVLTKSSNYIKKKMKIGFNKISLLNSLSQA